jgi:hypothetical protein
MRSEDFQKCRLKKFTVIAKPCTAKFALQSLHCKVCSCSDQFTANCQPSLGVIGNASETVGTLRNGKEHLGKLRNAKEHFGTLRNAKERLGTLWNAWDCLGTLRKP